MPLVFEIAVITKPVPDVEVPADIAADMAEVYAALAVLPGDRCANVDFLDLTKEHDETAVSAAITEAKKFMDQAKKWCADHKDADGNAQPLTFARKGDIKGIPTRVSFRVYAPRPKTGTENPAEVPVAPVAAV